MNNEYYGVSTTPMDDYLAHYGIKGMRWGVRKAVVRGDDRALARQYRKAEKKLAKLEKHAQNGAKYSKRAKVLGGAGVAAAGLAAGSRGIGKLIRKAPVDRLTGAGAKMGASMAGSAGRAMLDNRVNGAIGNNLLRAGRTMRKPTNIPVLGKVGASSVRNLNASNASKIARIGGGLVGAGLIGAAGYNAYRAATTKKAAKKAAEFRSAMNKTFAGTKYANGRPVSQKRKRR